MNWLAVLKPLFKKFLPVAKNAILEEGKDRSGIVKFGDAEDFENIKNKSAIIFIHGFRGHMDDTWGDTLKYLREDKQLDNWSFYSLGYNTHLLPNLLKGIWIAAPSIDVIGENLKGEIQTLLGMGYKTISICAHSMGGLVTQSALLKLDKETLQKIHAVMLFGTPSNGLKKAMYGKKINDQIRDMAFESDFIVDIREKWNKHVKDVLTSRFLAVAGDHDEFVPRVSSLDPFSSENRKIIGGDHLRIVKPLSANDQTVTTIKGKLLHENNYNMEWEPAAMAVEYADYRKAIEVYDKTGFDNLDKSNKRNYILATEALGNTEKALELAEKISSSSIDALGVLGGRYKRQYLSNRSQVSLDKSIEFYTKGYNLAIEAKNDEQIYYQSINLAFLHLLDDEVSKARSVAQIAYDAASRSTLNNVWKFATLAEADLHLGNIDDAIVNYTEAKERSKNIREQDSILINATETAVELGFKESERERIVAVFR